MPTDVINPTRATLLQLADQGVDITTANGMVDMDPELQYCLCSAVELGEMSPVDYVIFTHDTPPSRELQRLREADQFWSANWLRNTSRHYFDQLKREEQYVIALYAMNELGTCMRALHERMEFVVQQKCLKDLGLIEDFSRLIWDHDPDLTAAIPAKVFEGAESLTRDRVQQFAAPLFVNAVDQLEADIELTRQALIWAADDVGQQRARSIAHNLLRIPLTGPLARISVEHLNPRAVAVAQRKKATTAKAAIKKALKLLTRFGAEENTRLLVSGEEVRISHPDSPFQFRLKAHKHSGWLIDRTVCPGGHVPYELTLETKSNQALANLCVIFQDTPVLDQLLALTMFVQTGDELELLEKANWFGIADQREVLDYLEAHAPTLVPKLKPRISVGTLRIETEGEVFWQPYKGPVRSWLGETFLPARDMLNRIQLSLTANAPQALA